MASPKPIQNVLLVGVTGRIGRYILDAVLDSAFNVHVLTREKGLQADAPAQHSTVPKQSASEPSRLKGISSGIPVHTTDYSLPSLVDILRTNNIHAVICAISAMPDSVKTQHVLIDASLLVPSVKLFIPSEWGMDTFLPKTREMVQGLFDIKWEVLQRLQSLSQEGKLDWTAVICGAFIDLCVHDGELDIDLDTKTVTIWENGDVRAYGCTMPFVGLAVRCVLERYSTERKNLANKAHYIAEAKFTQIQLMAFVKKQYPGEWTVQHTTVADGQQKGKDAFAKGDVLGAIQPLLFSAGWSGCFDFEGNGRELSNAFLGLGEPDLDKAWVGVEAWDKAQLQ